jgi:hypothetical protein
MPVTGVLVVGGSGTSFHRRAVEGQIDSGLRRTRTGRAATKLYDSILARQGPEGPLANQGLQKSTVTEGGKCQVWGWWSRSDNGPHPVPGASGCAMCRTRSG